MTDMAQRIAALSPEKRELLLRQLNTIQDQQQEAPPQPVRQSLSLQPVSREQPLPLSFAQQRLWFLDQLVPGNTAYLLPHALSMEGTLDMRSFERSLHALVQRHESLRTTFAVGADRAGPCPVRGSDSELVQVVHPAGSFSLPVVDLQVLLPERREEEAQRLISQESQHPCDLTRGPLLRTSMLRLSRQVHMLLLTLHHIITDGWSYEILVRELSILYRSHVSGQSSPLAPLPIQYADYALWQRQWLQGEGSAQGTSQREPFLSTPTTQLAYWRKQLVDVSPLALPTDHPRKALQTFRGAREERLLPEVVSSGLMTISQQAQVTLFMTLLAAWQVLLARWSGETDIVVGTPIANRTLAELEGVIGFFANTLVIRTNLGDNPTFEQVLRQVREVCLGAYAHQDIPFEKVVEELQPERDMSRSPLFQVMFILQKPPLEQTDLAGVSIRPLAVETTTSKFDLTLELTETEEGLYCALVYSTDLFEADTIRRMLTNFQTLLAGVIQSLQTHISDLSLLTEAERQLVACGRGQAPTLQAPQVASGTRPTYDSPQDLCIHQLFERQVVSTPDAVALVFEEQHLTYMELNRQSDHLAHLLREVGVGPDGLVGVCLERSLELVVAQLSVLKAGAAYVPLDPGYPAERLVWMLADALPVVVLTQTRLMTALPAINAQIVCLDAEWERITHEPLFNPTSQVVSQNLAYVIYTSGSTGKPKGVMVTHRNVLHLFAHTREHFHFHSQDVWTLFHSCAFDFSVWELWGALLHGGRLLIVPYWLSRSPDEFYRLLEASQVTILNQTPSAFRQLIQAEQCCAEDAGLALRLVIFGGEALDVGCLGPWFARHGDASPQLVNMYGITETTVHVTTRVLAQTDVQGVGSLIGAPLADLECYVLDRHQQLVPPGVAGELYVGGIGLARGYLKRPDLTAERFVPHPFAGTRTGARLYRTGDLARYRETGDLEYLGRVDHQVKLRGFRIELGEIEASLRAHPGVQEAVVMLCEDEKVGPYLVAYVGKASLPLEGQGFDQPPTQAELQSYLREQLPDYMVPTVFVELQTLPLTQSGKVNRKALPVPERTAQRKEGYVAPQSELEQRLAEIWQEVLGIGERVGIHDNFFDLGGHSLLLIQVRSKLGGALGYDVPVVDLFLYPTIHALSTYLSGRQAQQALLQPIAERVRKRKGALSPEELETAHDGIAIVGLAGRFPGARNVDEFWQHLCDGVESISFFSQEELLASGVEPDLIENPRYVKAHGRLDDVESFDAAFFGYNPKEATMMDPQQRLFLECAWEVLEQAGVIERSGASDTYRGPIGVYAGQSASSYLLSNMLADPTYLSENGAFSTLISNDKDFLATRTSYKLSLEGPSMTIQTACSTSLVAVHMACQGLLRYECDMALAGGVSILVPQKMGYLYEEEGILSPDGHCRAFDADARGTVSGSGVGVVALKRLGDAMAAGDTIYAVIRGSAINNDGAAKVGYTAPSIKGQVKVITEALVMAGVEPESISYVETHGTGTALGDPIEIAALTQAFRAKSGGQAQGTAPVVTSQEPTHYCAIGSVKTNIGHLDAASGVTGLIKTVLALKHEMLPPSLHFHHPNPKIGFAKTPFYVNTHLKPWKRGSTPRRAGVSSFGLGGTNAHVILEEAPSINKPRRDSARLLSGPDERPHLVVLSAKTASALESMTEQLATYVKAHPDAHLADMAYTLQMGRKSFAHRRAFVVRSRTHMLHLLETREPESVFTDVVSPETKQVAFLFPGQGTQYVNMGRELYETEPDFRDQIDTCARLLTPHLRYDLREIIYPSTGAGTHQNMPEGQSLRTPHYDLREIISDRSVGTGLAPVRVPDLHQIGTTQPALFVVEYALAQLLMKWGIHPQAMIGHSLGEYVAACLTGVFELPDALALVALRGRLMQALPPGAMLSIMLPEKDIEEFLGEELSLAACNGTHESVVSGTREAIERLEKHLMEKGISCLRLHTSHASHSQMMEPILEQFASHVSKIALHPPKIPYISNVTGTWITDQEATNPAYWAQHLRQTVRFNEGMQRLLDSPTMIMLEVGPGHTLSALARWAMVVGTGQERGPGAAQGTGQGPDRTAPTDQIVLSSLRHPQTSVSDRAFLLNTCGRLWCAGVAIDWSQLYADEQRRRIPLPTYPFERVRYWTLPSHRVGTGLAPVRVPIAPAQGYQENSSLLLRKEPDLAQWFSVPSWKQSPLPALPILPDRSEQKACWLIFTDTLGLGTRLREHLREQGDTVITVRVGTQFQCHRSEVISAPTSSASQAGSDGWECTLRPECREDYDSLLNALSSYSLFPTHIIHMWMVIAIDQISSELDYFETAQTLGFYSLLFLTQALGKQNVGSGSDAAGVCPQSQEVALISNNLQEVIGQEVLCSVRATALGVGRIAPYEYSHISFRCIDIVLPDREHSRAQLVDQMITELRSCSSDLMVAYRGTHRWVRSVEPVRLEKVPEEEQPLGQSRRRLQGKIQRGLRHQGVYLITGGLGGIGLTVAEDLARRVRARLVLTGRTVLPAREEWDRMLTLANEQDGASGLAPEVNKIRQVKRLEELGAEVLVIQADVTDLEQMQAVIQQIRQRFGELHGVLHTAGIIDEGLIQMRRPEVAAKILAPKVKGTLVLEAVLKDVQLDFLVLFSSLAALIGELGRVDYCAANIFLDSFAFYHTAQRGVRTISIDWDGWRGVGMTAKDPISSEKVAQSRPELQMRLGNTMSPQEAVEAFGRIIAYGTTPQLIVSTSNMLVRLQRAEAYLHPEQPLISHSGGLSPGLVPTVSSGRQAQGPVPTHPRPHLQTPYVAPQNETQQQIADLWQKFLGIEKIGIHDNFIDLGGNSLLATQLITRVRDMFQVDLTLRTLFEEPTIARLAMLLVEKKAELIDDALLLQDIEDVEHLTDDEVQALLAADTNQTERTQSR